MRRSEALKGLVVKPLAERVDDALELFPRTTLDFADEAIRTKMRGWLQRFGEGLVSEQTDAFSEAASRAVTEMGQLLIDPNLYETRRRYKADRAKRRKQHQAQQAAMEQNRPAPPRKERK